MPKKCEKVAPRLRQGSEMEPKTMPKWIPEPPFSQLHEISKITTPLQPNWWFWRSGRAPRQPKIEKKSLRKRGEEKDPKFSLKIRKSEIWEPFWDPPGVQNGHFFGKIASKEEALLRTRSQPPPRAVKKHKCGF